MRSNVPHITAALAVAGAVALSGCGGSSKPQYCSDRSTLEKDVKALGDIKVLSSGGPQQVKAQLSKIESDARALVSSAKSDFPTQTSAIDSSLSTLRSAAQSLPSSPSAKQLATVATDVTQVVTAVQDFVNASNSKCS